MLLLLLQASTIMDIHFIRENTQAVKDNQRKRFADEDIVDKILQHDKEFKRADFEASQLRKYKNILSASFNSASKNEIIVLADMDTVLNDIINGSVMLSSLTKAQLSFVGKHINSKIDKEDKICKKALVDRDQLILLLGNMLHADVPVCKNEDGNVVVCENNNNNKDLPDKKYDHNDLCKMLDCVDSEAGIKIAGNRGYFLTGCGVKLNLALINYAMDFLEKRNYKLISTPHTVNKDFMSQITQLSDYEDTLYKLEGTDKYLIATSEQPLTAYFSDKHFHTKELPIKVAGLSSCYRKETGAHGKQTRGIYRVHQFEKVEQFCVADAETSWQVFHDMMSVAREFYDSLGINYRVINIASGSLNSSASMKYDLEAWFPGSKFYGELVSCTNCLDYFSKRLNVRKTDDKKFLHMLNCTLCANTRVLCCLLESYQTEEGVVVPEVLRKYMGIDFLKYKQ